MKTALLLIDIQNDYFPGGKMALEGSLEASQCAKELLVLFRAKEIPLIHIQHISTHPKSTFFLPGTIGLDFHQNVMPLPNEMVIQKNYPNSFRNTALLESLKKNKITQLVMVGMMTHMCVDATIRAAFDHGFQCTLVQDACATKSLSFEGSTVSAEQVQTAFLAALNGVYARVVGHEKLILDLSDW
jgi:nicotinamidase-related amidase